MADLDVVAPVTGRVVPLEQLPDPVFASAMVGPGIAIEPDEPGEVTAVAPVAGIIGSMHPHAYIIAGPGGGAASVLVHLGIDTVQLKGKGFTLLAEQGDEVVVGQPLIRWNPTEIVAGGRSAAVPVIALAGETGCLQQLAGEHVTAGDVLIRWSIEDF